MKNVLHQLIVCCLLAAFAASGAAAQNIEIRLSDGSRWRGEVGDQVEMTVRQRGVEIAMEGRITAAADLYITLEVDVSGDLRARTIFRADIVSIRKAADAPAPRATQPGRPATRPGEARSTPAAPQADQAQAEGPGVFVLPLTGTVGIELRHQEIEAIALEADKYGPGQIIVLELTTGGGLVLEMEMIAPVILEAKKRHRFVAYIHEAISGGCATAILCDEIYFSSMGTAGSMTMFAGSQAAKGEELQKWLSLSGKWMSDGGRHPYIAHAMIHAPLSLSYDKDPDTGEVEFYNTLQGQYILSRPGENLTFNASNALHCGFSDGTADTYEDLAKLLNLPEWREISDYGRKLHADWLRTVERANEEVPRLIVRLDYYKQGGGNVLEVLGARISIMEQLAQWTRRAPQLCRIQFGLPPTEWFERQIAELRKQVADIRRAQRDQRPPRR